MGKVFTLYSYELNIAKYRSNPIHVGRAPRQPHFIEGAVAVGLQELRHSWLYKEKTFEEAQQIYAGRIRDAFNDGIVFTATRSNKGQVQVVGFASLRDNEITMIAVLNEFQTQGLGRRLINKCLDAAVESGYRTVLVKTQESNSEAQAFYNKLGFERTG